MKDKTLGCLFSICKVRRGEERRGEEKRREEFVVEVVHGRKVF